MTAELDSIDRAILTAAPRQPDVDGGTGRARRAVVIGLSPPVLQLQETG